MSDRPWQMGVREWTSHRMTQTVSPLSRLNSAVGCRVIENLRRPVEHVQRAHITLLSSDRRPVLEIAKRGRHQPSGGTALDVQARHLVERVEGEAVGLFCPGGADCFIGRQATESFESPTEIVGVDEVGEMLPELIVCFVVVASDCSTTRCGDRQGRSAAIRAPTSPNRPARLCSYPLSPLSGRRASPAPSLARRSPAISERAPGFRSRTAPSRDKRIHYDLRMVEGVSHITYAAASAFSRMPLSVWPGVIASGSILRWMIDGSPEAREAANAAANSDVRSTVAPKPPKARE